MTTFMIRGSVGGTWSTAGSNNSPFSFGSSNLTTSLDNTTSVGICFPFQCVVNQFTCAFTKNQGGLGQSVLPALTKNGVSSQVFSYQALDTNKIYTLAPAITYAAGDYVNFEASLSGGDPLPPATCSIVTAKFDFNDPAFDNYSSLFVVQGELSVASGTLAGRLAYGAGADNSVDAGIGGMIPLPFDASLFATSFTAKTSANAVPTGVITVDMLKQNDTDGITTVRSDGLPASQFSSFTVLTDPISFNKGDAVTGNIQSTTDALIVIASYWFRER